MRRTRAIAVGVLIASCMMSSGADAETLEFAGSCDEGERITIAAVGDLLFHKRLQLQAYDRSDGFRGFWAPVAGILRDADMTYGNLESPVAHGVSETGEDVEDPGPRLDLNVYNGYPLFNVHPAVLGDLQADGFDVVSTANNHALDRGPLGVDRTADSLRAQGIAFSGTHRRGGGDARWSTVVERSGISVAWLACTTFTNVPRDAHDQVLSCTEERDVVLGEIRRLAEDRNVDAVILTPHWGEEDSSEPAQEQRDLARAAVAAGAVAVLGTHPHIVQPWEKMTTPSGSEALVVYSTGNFISDQRFLMQRAGIIALLELVKTGDGGTRLAGAGFVPTWVLIDNVSQWESHGHTVVSNASSSRSPEALRAQLAILPDGNRVSGDNLSGMPGECGAEPALTLPTVAPGGEGVDETESLR
jgi:poly-gamma-glutamate synthesis protein (capsule biosynthesis protein)